MYSFKKILKAVAKKNGVSTQEVMVETQRVIDLAFSDSDPQVRARWQNIPHKGEKPTVEEVVMFCVLQCKAESKMAH